MMKLFLLVFIVLVFAQEPISSSDIQKYIKPLKEGATPKDIHATVLSLTSFDKNLKDFGVDSTKLCPELSKIQEKDPKSIYHLAASLNALSCDNFNVDDIEARLTENLGKTSTSDMFYTIRSIYLLRKKLKSLPNDQVMLKKMFEVLFKRFDQNTGLFCSDKSEKCLEETGFALKSMTTFSNLLTEDLISNFAKVASKTNLIVSSFRQLSKPSLSTTSKLISGLNKLSDIVPLKSKITKEDLEFFRKVILLSQDSSSFDLIDFIEGYSSVAESNIHPIFYISEIKNENKQVKIEIKDLWGRLPEKVLLRVYNAADEDTNIVENEELKKMTNEFVWNYEKIDLGTGLIQLEFTIISKVTEQKVLKSLKFETDIVIKDFKVSIHQKQLNDLLVLRLNYPDQLQQKVNLNTNYTFAVSFSIFDSNKKDIVPHQLFFRMVHVQTQNENTFLIRKLNSEFKIEIDIARAYKEIFKNLKGEYELELVVADEVIKNPVFWSFGKVFIDLENSFSHIKPEISHLFKQPVKRPSVTVSSSFTLLTLVPLFLFFILIMKLANLSGCYNYSFNLLFQSSVLLMLMVIYLYWTSISIFETFGLLFLLGTFNIFIGSWALRK